jgi:peptidoglycan biosynthesis protein MviN/MurJ (putative lipid II flippase)
VRQWPSRQDGHVGEHVPGLTNDGPTRAGSKPRVRDTARNSFALGFSLLVTSLLGAAQALVLIIIAGDGPETEGFLAAYSIYLPIAILGASLRVTVMTLVASGQEENFERRAGEIVSRTILIGALVAVSALIASPLLAHFVSRGLPEEARMTTILALVLLLPAAFLHIVSAALSGSLSATRRFDFSAASYAITSLIALAVSTLLIWTIGPLGSAVGILAGTAVLALSHIVKTRAKGILVRLHASWLKQRDQWQIAVKIVSGASLGLALQVNLVVSLAALSGFPGGITAYSYGFFIASMILTVSALPLAVVTLPDLASVIRREGRDGAVTHMTRTAPLAFVIAAPLVAALTAFGGPVIRAAFEPFASPSVADLLGTITIILGVMTLPSVLFYLTSAVSLASLRPKLTLLAAGATIGIHVVLVSIVPHRPQAIAWAHCIGIGLSTVVLLTLTFRWKTPIVILTSIVAASPAFAFASVFLWARLALPSPSAGSSVVAIAACAVVYTALVRSMWSIVAGVVGAALRRPGVS